MGKQETTMHAMMKGAAMSAVIASAAAFTPPVALPALRGSKTAVCAAKFPQQAPADAPAADLFNSVLPPFSNIGNTERGDVENLFRVDDTEYVLADSGLKGQRAKGYARDFSTANPTSAYDTANFGQISLKNQDLIENPLRKGKAVEDIAPETQAKSKSQKTYALRSFDNFVKWRKGESNFDEKDGNAGLRGTG